MKSRGDKDEKEPPLSSLDDTHDAMVNRSMAGLNDSEKEFLLYLTEVFSKDPILPSHTERVRLEAVARRTKMAMIIRDSLTQYFSIQEELVSAIETPGNLGDNNSGKNNSYLISPY